MNDYVRSWDNENRKWIYEHRVVMENYLGRKLTPDEHIHHINGNIKDNTVKNLQIVSKDDHIRLHKPAKKSIDRLCSLIDCDKKHHAKGLCKKHYRQTFPEKYYSNEEVSRGWRIG